MNTADTLRWDANGLIPAIVQDAATQQVLMLGWMNRDALALTRTSGFVTFWSRSRQTLWRKGETSGHMLEMVSLAYDCDGDALLVQAVPHGPTCHTGATSCFYRALPADDFLSVNEIGDDRE